MINLTNVWRVQCYNTMMFDPCIFSDMVGLGFIDISDVVCLWRVKGYKTLAMLNETVLIPIK